MTEDLSETLRYPAVQIGAAGNVVHRRGQTAEHTHQIVSHDKEATSIDNSTVEKLNDETKE